MLVLKNWDTNLRWSERKTLFRFLALYALLTLLILFFGGIFYYESQKELLLQSKKEELSALANAHIARLKILHNTFDKDQTYPRDIRYESAIYDSNLKQIFSTLHSENVNLYKDLYLKAGYIYLIKELEQYYIGSRYIALEIPAPQEWSSGLNQRLFWYGGLVFLVLVAVGYFLLSLFLKPMREAIALLDRFIKDTTHELNTPINTILSNIEMMDQSKMDATMLPKIRRITIASRTISNLYEDLTYLVLSHTLPSLNETIDIQALIEERLDYFSVLFDSKKILLSTHFDAQPTLLIDRKKLTKLIDNLLSNAVKYNVIGGKIDIHLEPSALHISDSGYGIEPHQLEQIFERYTRFNTSVGGFGIGLSIVALIAKEYHLHVSFSSKPHLGTTVHLSW